MVDENYGEGCNMYDLSSGPLARDIRARRLREQFQEQEIKKSRNMPWEAGEQPISIYDTAGMHKRIRRMKEREDAYVNARLR